MAAWADSMPRRTGMRSKSLDSLLPWTLSRRRSMSKVGMSVGPPMAQRPLEAAFVKSRPWRDHGRAVARLSGVPGSMTTAAPVMVIGP